MMTNTAITRLKDQVRVLMGEELALIRGQLSQGKKIKVSVGKSVSFRPRVNVLSGILAGILVGGLSLLCVSAIAQPRITLTWDVVTNSPVAGYRLYLGTASRAYSNTIDTATMTQVTVSNLAAGVAYYFAVTAYTSTGLESDFSSEISHEVQATNNPVVLQLSQLPGRLIQLRGSGPIGRAYDVLATTDFVSWIAISTVTNDSMGLFNFVDMESESLPSRAYRLRELGP